MRINQDELRQQLKDFLARTGVRQSFISTQLGLSKTSLAVFKHGSYNLAEDKAEALKRYLENWGNA